MLDHVDSIRANVAQWTRTNREHTDAAATRAWAADAITWGIFGVADEALGSPLDDPAGLDVVEPGCGTAYFSAWLAMRGARPVGVDPTAAQLATARRLQEETGIRFPLIEAPAENVPLPDHTFDDRPVSGRPRRPGWRGSLADERAKAGALKRGASVGSTVSSDRELE